MKAVSFVLDTPQSIKNAIRLVDLSQLEEKPHLFSIKEYTKDRSIAQNKLLQLWNKQIHEQRKKINEMPIDTKGQIRAFNKVKFGVPIMLEDPDFENSWRLATSHLNYFALLEVVEHLDIPVTRLMKVKQFKRHLEDLELFWTQKGVVLTTGDDMYMEAMGRRR